MALQYVGLSEINGPLVVLDHVKDASYDEMVELQLKDGSTRSGRIVEIEGERVVVQVFEGTNALSLANTKTIRSSNGITIINGNAWPCLLWCR